MSILNEKPSLTISYNLQQRAGTPVLKYRPKFKTKKNLWYIFFQADVHTTHATMEVLAELDLMVFIANALIPRLDLVVKEMTKVNHDVSL